MKQFIAIAVFGLSMTIVPGGAQACRFARPPPPMIPEPYDALVVAEAPADIVPPPGATGERWPAFRVVEVLDGSVRARRIHIRQELAPAPDAQGVVVIIDCSPPPADRIRQGQALRAGERVLAVVRREQGVDLVISWTPLDQAMRAEPFVALYLRARVPEERRKLADHWREGRRRRGR